MFGIADGTNVWSRWWCQSNAVASSNRFPSIANRPLPSLSSSSPPSNTVPWPGPLIVPHTPSLQHSSLHLLAFPPTAHHPFALNVECRFPHQPPPSPSCTQCSLQPRRHPRPRTARRNVDETPLRLEPQASPSSANLRAYTRHGRVGGCKR
ncbi:hypothetical protein FA13DRAFT_1324911 [Coprinellus micaceus]|uniref:Uncharacterized protein n=1 Tax=Coprinellus micaceus TaxID=71717 RepID=A0A4Y7SRN0_COPMI|nr:hypothetical protein FA13DRAFT_1324911 [Coprinellus micaceus]